MDNLRVMPKLTEEDVEMWDELLDRTRTLKERAKVKEEDGILFALGVFAISLILFALSMFYVFGRTPW